MKRVLCLLATSVMALSCLSAPVLAENANVIPAAPVPVATKTPSTSHRSLKDSANGIIPPKGDTEIAPDVLNSRIQADYEEYLAQGGTPNLITPYTIYWQTEGSSPYIYYQQNENFTCGLASTQMALQNINGSLPSEKDLISSLGINMDAHTGADVSAVKNTLNTYQSRGNYDVQWYKDIDLMKSQLFNTLVSSCSPIVNVSFTSGSVWPYTTGGHYMTIYSMLSDYSQVAICDPYGGYAGQSSWRWYERSTSDLFSALKHGYFYTA